MSGATLKLVRVKAPTWAMGALYFTASQNVYSGRAVAEPRGPSAPINSFVPRLEDLALRLSSSFTVIPSSPILLWSYCLGYIFLIPGLVCSLV